MIALYFNLIWTIVQTQVLVFMMPLMKLTLEMIYLKPTLPKTLNQQDYLGVYVNESFSIMHEQHYNFKFVIFRSYLFIFDFSYRLLTKLCTVVDRADLNGDASWSEYGDRYMLKLFRDYIFHQVKPTAWKTLVPPTKILIQALFEMI